MKLNISIPYTLLQVSIYVTGVLESYSGGCDMVVLCASMEA